MRPALLLPVALVLACGPDADTVVTGIHSDNPVVREDMVQFARKFDEPKVVGALMETLGDPSANIRVEVVESLAELGHKAATAPLLQLYTEDPSAEVRKAAVDALGRIADPRAVPLLIQVLEETPPDLAPLDVIWALGNIGDRRALPVLSVLREQATDPYVVYNTNEALRKIR